MDDKETARLSRNPAEELRATPAESTYIVVQHANGGSVIPLQLDKPLTLGRTSPSDVIVADASLSRLHARFCLTPQGVVVEDLGSTNGTTFRGQPTTQAVLARGDEVLLGTVSVTVHGTTSGLDADEIGSHDRFVRWVDEELGRARYFRRPLCVLMARPVEGKAQDWLQHLRSMLRPIDRIGQYASGVLEVVAPEMSARDLRQRIAPPGRDPHDSRFFFGIAQFPDMANSTEELVGAAYAAQRRATTSSRIVLAVEEGSQTGVKRSSPPGAHPPVAESDAMRELCDSIDRVAKAVVPVLLVGETGTGKEVLARYLHESGPRRKKPLVSVNCAAIPAQLLESTLFGHERGAFTGATQQSSGVFEAANEGTVFLDEIGELPAPAQAALLRVLETKRFTRVGSTREIAVDVRVVTATHRDLEKMVTAGSFREDLLYRLNTVTMKVPPLRERRADIPALVTELLGAASQIQEVTPPPLDPEVLALFEAYHWPGNVRELRNVLERALAIKTGPSITIDDVPERMRALIPEQRTSTDRPSSEHHLIDLGALEGDYWARIEHLESELIRDALEQQGGNQTRTAQAMGIPLRTLVHKIKLLGIKKPGA